MHRANICSRLFSIVVLFAGIAAAQQKAPTPRQPEVGKVHFSTSCSPAVQSDFDRAVAMLHSFWYGEANKTFESVAARDPKCAMAYWGEAMTRYHQLWGPNNVDDPGGKAAVAHARELASGASPRESEYIEAIGAYYDAAGKADAGKRAQIYAAAMAKLFSAHPDDPEAAVFDGLALIATADPSDRSFAQRKNAAEILKKVETQQPDHPGVAHYLIHAYDAPELAQLGLPAARKYARIAPAAPHALHMPAHIFTQLGLWDEAIPTDVNAVAASRQEEELAHEQHPGGGRIHSYDFLVNAYLQKGDDTAAKKIVDELAGLHGNGMGRDVSTQHALAAIPARFALERRDWAAAEKLPVAPGTTPLAEAITRMARGVGAARLGHVPAARQEILALQNLEINAPSQWKSRVHVEWLIVAGLLAHVQHQDEQALNLLKTTQESIETAPGMPPPILPARQVLAEVLLESGKPADALKEFEASDKATPNWYHTVAGAFRAAREAHKTDAANQYAQRLLALTRGVATERTETKEASEYLANAKKQAAAK